MLTLQEPNGNDVSEPSLEFLRERVLHADLEYWNGPGGGAGLFRRERGNNADLLLIVRSEGCLVTHRTYRPGVDTWVALPPGDEDPSARVVIYDGQNDVPVHPRFLVPREMAWRAVEEFVTNQRPAPDLRWEDEIDMDEPV